jgi:hypothetical protein
MNEEVVDDDDDEVVAVSSPRETSPPEARLSVVDKSDYSLRTLEENLTPALTSLVLERVVFEQSTERALELVGNAFASPTQLVNLERLRLYGLSVSDATLCQLFESMRGHARLTSLNLCGLGFGDVAMTALADMCRASTALGELWLASAAYGAEGLRPFCQMLRTHPRIASVSFSGNVNIDDECAMMITAAMCRNRVITRLYISDTRITFKARTVMFDELWEHNLTLKQIDPHMTWRSNTEGAAAYMFSSLIARNNQLPQADTVYGRLVEIAFALASLDLSLLELIEVFDSVDVNYRHYPYHLKWNRVDIIKRAYRAKLEQQR